MLQTWCQSTDARSRNQQPVDALPISFTETCSGTATAFTGIATLNTEKTRLTVTATTASDAKGTALLFVKP